MSTVIQTRLVKIGNSQGLRIPKIVLEQLDFSHTIELEVQDDQLIVRPVKAARADWASQFERMAEHGDDQLIDADTTPTQWEEREWQW